MSLPRDISTADALRHLSRPDVDPNAIDRRRFLQLIGMGAGAGLVGGGASSLLDAFAPGHDPSAWAAGPIGAHDGVLVVIGMFGGNDGLNMVAPVDDPNYVAYRRGVALDPATTLPLADGNALHPALTELKRWWDAGHLAVVQGVGYPDQDESHFNSMAYWMAGAPHTIPQNGWLGRWLDGHLAGSHDLYAAAEVGSSVPLHVIGAATKATGVSDRGPGWGADPDGEGRDQAQFAALRRMVSGARGPWFAAAGQAVVDSIDVNARLGPFVPDEDRGEELARKLTIAARLINANLGFRVLTAGWGDFDSHAGQPGMHNARMGELNTAIGQFFGTLDPAWLNRVTIMTFSEFGRTAWSNDGQGTDHGSAAPHFVIGGNVRGGLYGQRPSLANLDRWERQVHTVDFRAYYASILDGWMGGGSSEVLGGSFEDLRLFAAGPGDGTPSTPLPPFVATSAGAFVPLTPVRVADTRAAGGPLGPDAVLTVPIAGAHGVPPVGATAVVANVTAVDATQPHFFTVYPGGTGRPGTSSINGGPGRPVPNLVVVGLGAAGTIEVFNSHGTAHCLVDVFGYFTSGDGAGFTPLTPARLFDTRDGAGGVPAGKLGEAPIDIAVAGQAGVPDEATAVVVNLTAAETDGPGFLRLTPTGSPPASTSNVNFFAGDVVPNLAIVQLGEGGRVTLEGAGSGKHAIGDVFGYFAPDAGGRFRAVAPQRLLDTRESTPVGPGAAIDVQVTDRAGVPGNATAVVLNVAAMNVTGPSFVTVWPAGAAQPGTSNLNVMPGQTIANLVICQLGDNGNLSIANPIAQCDVLADVMGFVVPS